MIHWDQPVPVKKAEATFQVTSSADALVRLNDASLRANDIHPAEASSSFAVHQQRLSAEDHKTKASVAPSSGGWTGYQVAPVVITTPAIFKGLVTDTSAQANVDGTGQNLTMDVLNDTWGPRPEYNSDMFEDLVSDTGVEDRVIEDSRF
jgi:hypothetical protein